ncbi:hypothetical protein ABZ644_23675 [Nocardiopsis alba]|uniref:hypothetical protein n=1 Tax=Nocardiopsis alba TaxID=53437 RepID=UPI00340D68D5
MDYHAIHVPSKARECGANRGGSASAVVAVPVLLIVGPALSLLVRAVAGAGTVLASVRPTTLVRRLPTSVLSGVKEWFNSWGGGVLLTGLLLRLVLVPPVLDGFLRLLVRAALSVVGLLRGVLGGVVGLTVLVLLSGLLAVLLTIGLLGGVGRVLLTVGVGAVGLLLSGVLTVGGLLGTGAVLLGGLLAVLLTVALLLGGGVLTVGRLLSARTVLLGGLLAVLLAIALLGVGPVRLLGAASVALLGSGAVTLLSGVLTVGLLLGGGVLTVGRLLSARTVLLGGP